MIGSEGVMVTEDDSMVAAHTTASSPTQRLATTPTRRDRLAIPALLLASVVSNTGNNLTAIAIPWFVLVTTGSPARTGVVAFAGLLPVAIAGVIGGAVVDRLGFKRSSIVADLASGVTVGLIPVLHFAGVLQFWQLLALAFCGGIFDVPGSSARGALLPKLAARVNMPLERANATYQMGQVFASIIGPLLAGVLIVAISAANVMYLDSASFFISAAVIAVGVSLPRSTTKERAESERSPFGAVREGLCYVRGQPLIMLFMATTICANFLFTPLFAVVFPVYAKQVFDSPTALGILETAFGAGSVLTTVLYGIIGPRLRRFPTLVACMLVGLIGIWILPLSSTLALSAAAGFVIGSGLGPVNVLSLTVLQERTPDEMMGRMLGLMMASSQLATPLGVLLAGFLIAGVGVRGEMVVIAAGFSAVVVIALLHPVMRSIDRPGESELLPAPSAG
jgi:MFS family permease